MWPVVNKGKPIRVSVQHPDRGNVLSLKVRNRGTYYLNSIITRNSHVFQLL